MAAAKYYIFTPCCQGVHPVYFKETTVPLPTLPYVYSYTGPTTVDSMGHILETGRCFLVTEVSTSDFAFVASLFDAPSDTFFVAQADTCPVDPTVECPCETPQNANYISYTLQPCCGGDPTIVYFVDEFLVENGVYVYTSPSPYGGLVSPSCYTANRYSYTGAGVPPFTQAIFTDFALVEEGCGSGAEPYTSICDYFCLPCICKRFLWTGTAAPGTYAIQYVDCNNEVQTLDIPTDGTTWTDKVCMKTVLSTCPNPGICWTSESFGDCTLDAVTDTYECNKCYELVDCAGIEENIYTLNQQVGQYVATQQVIQIQGSDTCWTVRDTNNDCSCAVNVSVQLVFSKCETCLNPKGYLLTECTTGATQYTTTDLSDYTTVIIKTDCGGCWTVTELDIIPPTSVPVTVLNGFTDCETCNATFYQLTDCLGAADPIITITDLSQYVDQVVELKYCPNTCWIVTRTTPQEISGDVIVEQSFGASCADCLVALLTPQCVEFTNTNTIPEQLTYTDLEGTRGLRLTLAPGETLPKSCYLSYSVRTTVTVTEYGACINGLCPPVNPLVYRSVRPGYNTGTCNPEYYENVQCNYADVVYKNVLEQRYGIANCCPEDDIKWEVKHELLMLDILVDPNYTCSVGTCNCPTKCDCGFISLNVVYNTCPNPTPVPPVDTCFIYNVSILALTGTVLHYKNCSGVDTAIVIPPNKVVVMYPICGITGQTTDDIYCEFPVSSFSFIETLSPC